MYKDRLIAPLITTFLLLISASLAACSDEIVVPTPVATIAIAAEEANAESIIPTPLPPLDEAALNITPEASPQQQEIEQLFASDLGIQLSPDGSAGIQAVSAFETASPTEGSPLWVAYTTGIRSFDPLQNHAIAIYEKDGADWKQVTFYEMAETPPAANTQSLPEDSLSPDYLGPGSIFPVTVELDRLWLQVDGGAGAHSGVFALLSFDGTTIKKEASAFSASPGAGSVEDLNGDGIGEVVLDSSDYYVFCYACGVRAPNFSILRWDGEAMVPVQLQNLPAEAPAALRTLNEQMVEQANAGLWKDALKSAEQIVEQNLSDPSGISQWNVAWVSVNGEARRLQAESQGGAYLLLDQVFYGDYATAVDAMRGYNPQSIFNSNSPLIVGTVAEGNQEALSTTLLTNLEGAINLYPSDAATAPAYFLRAWAHYLQGDTAAAQSDLQQASTLAPNDKLFSDSLQLLK